MSEMEHTISEGFSFYCDVDKICEICGKQMYTKH